MLGMVRAGKLYYGYDTKVLVMCVKKQILAEGDHTAILMMLSALSKIVALSIEKGGNIEKRKKMQGKNNSKINNNVRAYEDYYRFIKSIDSPFKIPRDESDMLT